MSTENNKSGYIILFALAAVAILVIRKQRLNKKAISDKSLVSEKDTIVVSEDIGKTVDRTPSPQELKNALRRVASLYSKPVAESVERIYRLETNNFKSNQFKSSLSPGMVAVKKTYPYGWVSLERDVWSKSRGNKPIGTVEFMENFGLGDRPPRKTDFVAFPNIESAMIATAYMINKRGRAGGWYSTDPEEMAKYEIALRNFPTHYTKQAL